MKGNKEKKGNKKLTNNKFKEKKVSKKSIPKNDNQIKEYKENSFIPPKNPNEIMSQNAIFDYKGNLTYIQCTIMEDMKIICEKFCYAMKVSITNFCFKINDNIIDFKLKFKDFMVDGKNYINISVFEINEGDKTKYKNYITAETIVDEENVNKFQRLIDTSQKIFLNDVMKIYHNYNNEIIKNCIIEINGITIPFPSNYGFVFKETGIFKIKYIFLEDVTTTASMFNECNDLYVQ